MRGKKLVAAAVLAASLATSVVVLSTTPASAASVCTYVRTEGVGIRVNGAIRQATGIGTVWTFWTGDGCVDSFPSGGQLYLRRLTLANGSTGGCTSSEIGSSVWVSFTGVNQEFNYGGLGAGQCFRMQGMAGNSNNDYSNHHGRLIY